MNRPTDAVRLVDNLIHRFRYSLRLACLAVLVLILLAFCACATREESGALVELASLQTRAAETGEAKRRAALEAYDTELKRVSALAMRRTAERDLLRAVYPDVESRPVFSFEDVKRVLDKLAEEGAKADADFTAKYKFFLADESFENLAAVAAAVDRWARGKLRDAAAVDSIKGAVK